jgi:hypothetical protein
MTRKNDCIVLSMAPFVTLTMKKKRELTIAIPVTLPKETNPAFADNASAGASFNSSGGVGDHKQGGALLSPAARLASTNS